VTLWRADQPLVLASRSVIRRELLERAGFPVEVKPADLDERALEQELGALPPEEVAQRLATAKAVAVSEAMPERLVLGADQVLALGDRRFDKPADAAEARAQLMALRGQTHVLHSALALAFDGDVIFECQDQARLTMRKFSNRFRDDYLRVSEAVVTKSVGGYQLENTGIHLFERIEGDHFTILGLPLLPLLARLRADGWVAD
jgi:septum formation protein